MPYFSGIRVAAALLAVVPAAAMAGEALVVEATILRPVEVHVPEARGSGVRPPLVVGLHGRGGTVDGFRGVWEMFREPRPFFAIPEAPYPLCLGRSSATLGWSWDFPTTDRVLWHRADPLVATFILDAARAVRSRFDTGDVYLLAHSQGGAYAYLAATQAPDLVRGVVVFAGILPDEVLTDDALRAAADRVEVFIAHGRRDEALPFRRSREAKARLEDLGFRVTYLEFEGGHEIPAGALREAQDWMRARERRAARAGSGSQ